MLWLVQRLWKRSSLSHCSQLLQWIVTMQTSMSGKLSPNVSAPVLKCVTSFTKGDHFPGKIEEFKEGRGVGETFGRSRGKFWERCELGNIVPPCKVSKTVWTVYFYRIRDISDAEPAHLTWICTTVAQHKMHSFFVVTKMSLSSVFPPWMLRFKWVDWVCGW